MTYQFNKQYDAEWERICSSHEDEGLGSLTDSDRLKWEAMSKDMTYELKPWEKRTINAYLGSGLHATEGDRLEYESIMKDMEAYEMALVEWSLEDDWETRQIEKESYVPSLLEIMHVA